MNSICILGRQPELGIAELESLFGHDNIQLIGEAAAMLSLDVSEVPYARLGGTVKLATHIDTIDTTNWNKIEKYFIDTLPQKAEQLQDGKLTIGISVYGNSVHKDQLNRTLLKIKKVLRSSGRSVRIVPNNEGPELSSAQVLHNGLTRENAWELLVIQDSDHTIIAQTTESQDIYAYRDRDQARPKRDAKVGMLPPKLAQIIVNLATGQIEKSKETELLSSNLQNEKTVNNKDPNLTNAQATSAVLDPFCGTGVVLQEAALMGYDIYGTDLEPRMVEYTADNITWLRDKYPLTSTQYARIEVGDATEFEWKDIVGYVAAETYLGRGFSAEPTADVLEQVIQDVNLIHKRLIRNLGQQLRPGTRICLGVPAWFTKNGIKRLSALDHLDEMGYNYVRFERAESPLIYHREGQFVGRELVVFEKK